MPIKDKGKRREYNKKYGADWYQRNREKTLERVRKRKKEQRQKFRDYKAGLSCFFCGFSHPAAIDFHHPDQNGDPKVSHLLQQGQFKKMWEEIEKCIPLCCNCHRVYHWMELEGEKDE